MRNFLTDVNIVGAVMVARSQELTHACLRNLLKWCDKIVVVLDNPDECSKNIVEDYAKKINNIKVVYSPYPGTTAEEERNDPMCIYHRFKEYQGKVRQLVFDEIFKMNNVKKVDILVWPDSDEIFSHEFPELLEKFWKSDYKAITMKAVDVFGDQMTIHDEGMTGHNRVFKYFPELTATPYRWGTNYLPLTRKDRMGSDYVLVHLSQLNEKSREWKKTHWSRGREMPIDTPLWRVGEDVVSCGAKKIKEVLKRKPDLNVFEYYRGGDKRMPVGVLNASDALFESTNILDGLGIKYYLAFGTCLGIFRDKELIEWDWDIDLIILGEDLKKIFPSNTEKEYLSFIKYMEDRHWSDIKIKHDLPKSKKDGKENNDNN